MAPNETTPTDSADEGSTSAGAESQTMPYAAELAPDDASGPTGPAPRKRATPPHHEEGGRRRRTRT